MRHFCSDFQKVLESSQRFCPDLCCCTPASYTSVWHHRIHYWLLWLHHHNGQSQGGTWAIVTKNYQFHKCPHFTKRSYYAGVNMVTSTNANNRSLVVTTTDLMFWCSGKFLSFDGLTNFMLERIWCGSEGSYVDLSLLDLNKCSLLLQDSNCNCATALGAYISCKCQRFSYRSATCVLH